MKKVIKKIFWCFHDLSFYKIVALIGLIIRVVFLPKMTPNIFETVADYFIGQLNVPQWAYEILLRLALFIIDSIVLLNIFYFLAYATVGNSYTKTTVYNMHYRYAGGWWGSLCYTIYYTIYWVAPVLLFNFFEWNTIIYVFTSYAVICIVIYLLSALFKTLPDIWEFIFRVSVQFIIFATVLILLCLHKAGII